MTCKPLKYNFLIYPSQSHVQKVDYYLRTCSSFLRLCTTYHCSNLTLPPVKRSRERVEEAQKLEEEQRKRQGGFEYWIPHRGNERTQKTGNKVSLEDMPKLVRKPRAIGHLKQNMNRIQNE
jgi:hypothetical protein